MFKGFVLLSVISLCASASVNELLASQIGELLAARQSLSPLVASLLQPKLPQRMPMLIPLNLIQDDESGRFFCKLKELLQNPFAALKPVENIVDEVVKPVHEEEHPVIYQPHLHHPQHDEAPSTETFYVHHKPTYETTTTLKPKPTTTTTTTQKPKPTYPTTTTTTTTTEKPTYPYHHEIITHEPITTTTLEPTTTQKPNKPIWWELFTTAHLISPIKKTKAVSEPLQEESANVSSEASDENTEVAIQQRNIEDTIDARHTLFGLIH